MMHRKQWRWINPKNPNESATIFYNEHTLEKPYQCIYYSQYRLDYRDYFKTLKGAKISLSRYVRFKTEWEEVIYTE